MKENSFSEKDSLELISQMLKQTKQNMALGNGNVFLLYGYSALVISILVFALVQFTGSGIWSALWFLMFAPSIVIRMKNAKEKPKVITYIDKAIKNTWSVIGALFILTVVAIIMIGLRMGVINFIIMLPLSLLYACIGTSITGVITYDRVLIYTPLLAFFIGIYMITTLISNGEPTVFWHLYFGISFVFMMIVPGHIINNKKLFKFFSKIIL